LSIQYKEYLENSSNSIAPVLPTEEPDNSLSMGDKHLSTIPKTELDEIIKSSVENLVLIPSEFKDFSDNEKSNSIIFDATIKSLSPSPIPVEDSDSHMEEIDLFLATDDLMPPGIENNDYDSEGDIYFLKEFLSDGPLPLLENESSNFDHHDDPPFPRPPLEPRDVEIFFDFEPDTGVLTTKVVKGISEHYVLMPYILPTQPTLCPKINYLLPFSFENKDKVFKTWIAPDLEASHARGFVHRPLELQSFAYGNPIF
nr:hypothetical protein [Tanacetum cinerariifolium]